MQTSRRSFIKSSAMLVAGASILSTSAFALAKKSGTIVGLQLYSVRDDMQKDPVETLKQLANMGYQHVEHANYVNRKFYGYTAPEFKKVLNDLGLNHQ